MIYTRQKCDAPGCEADEDYDSGPDWLIVAGRVICPRHTVTVEIDQTAFGGEQVVLQRKGEPRPSGQYLNNTGP